MDVFGSIRYSICVNDSETGRQLREDICERMPLWMISDCAVFGLSICFTYQIALSLQIDAYMYPPVRSVRSVRSVKSVEFSWVQRRKGEGLLFADLE